MTRRSPGMVVVLTIVTFGIYGLIWYVKTKDEMNTQGAQIPTAWLLIVPIGNLYWLWKFYEGVGVVTKGKAGGAVGFVLSLLSILALDGMVLTQSALNEVATGGAMQKAA